MLVGIVSGTYSTIFIASAIVILLSKQRRSASASAHAATGRTEAAPRPGRKSRGAKAS
jgi:hypothetical protein